MIQVTKLENSILFEFSENQHYLYNGSIEVPYNTLSIIQDGSDMITLRKAQSNDIFLSARYNDFGQASVDDAVDMLADNLFNTEGGGVDPEEVQALIDSALTPYWTSAETQNAITQATSGIPSSQVIEQLRTDVNTISGDVTNKYDKVSGITIDTNSDEDYPFIRIEKELEDGNTDYTHINDAGIDSAYENNEDGSVYGSTFGQGSIGNNATDSPDENVTSERNFNITTDGFEQTTFENYDDGETQYTRYSSENRFNYDNGLSLNQAFFDPIREEETVSSINIVNNRDGETYIEMTNTDEVTTVLKPTGVVYDGTETSWDDIIAGSVSYSAGTGIEIRNNVISASDSLLNDVQTISGKVDTSAVTSSVTSASTDVQIPTAKAVYDAIQAGGGGGITSGEVETMIEQAVSGVSVEVETLSGAIIDNEYVISQAINDINNRKADTSALTQVEQTVSGLSADIQTLSGDSHTHTNKAVLDDITASGVTSWNSAVTQLGGLSLRKVTTQEWGTISGSTDANTLYIISD